MRRTAASKAWRDANAWVEELRDAGARRGRRCDRPQAAARRSRSTATASSASACAPGLLDEVLAADDARRALLRRGRGAARRAERGVEGDRQVVARRARRRRSRPAPSSRRSSPRSSPSSRRPRPRCATSRCRSRTRPTRRCPTAARTTARSCASSASRRPRAGARPRDVRASSWASSTREHGAEVSGSRFAYLMREAVLLEFALVQWVLGRLVQEGFTPVVPPVLVREHVMEEAGFFPTDRNQVYDLPEDELFLVGHERGAALGAAPRRVLREADAPAPLRGLLHQLPARGRHVRQGHPRDLPGAPVRQDRDVLVRRIPTTRGRSTSASSRSRSRSSADLGLPYRVVNIAAGDLGARGGEEVRHRGLAPVRGQYRESHRARTTSTSRPAGSAPASAARAARRSCTR